MSEDNPYRPLRILRPTNRLASLEPIQILVYSTHVLLTICQDYDFYPSLARAKAVVREQGCTGIASLQAGARRIHWEDIPVETLFP